VSARVVCLARPEHGAGATGRHGRDRHADDGATARASPGDRHGARRGANVRGRLGMARCGDAGDRQEPIDPTAIGTGDPQEEQEPTAPTEPAASGAGDPRGEGRGQTGLREATATFRALDIHRIGARAFASTAWIKRVGLKIMLACLIALNEQGLGALEVGIVADGDFEVARTEVANGADIACEVWLKVDRFRVDFNVDDEVLGLGANLDTSEVLNTPEGDVQLEGLHLHIVAKREQEFL